MNMPGFTATTSLVKSKNIYAARAARAASGGDIMPAADPNICKDAGPGDMYHPNPKDCSSFYQCIEGSPHLIRCPEGLHFSIDYGGVCTWPQDANCKEISD